MVYPLQKITLTIVTQLVVSRRQLTRYVRRSMHKLLLSEHIWMGLRPYDIPLGTRIEGSQCLCGISLQRVATSAPMVAVTNSPIPSLTGGSTLKKVYGSKIVREGCKSSTTRRIGNDRFVYIKVSAFLLSILLYTRLAIL